MQGSLRPSDSILGGTGLRVNADHLNGGAYLCQEESRGGPITPKASAFFIGVVQDDESVFLYAVTARHCIEAAGARPLYLRVNLPDRYLDITTDSRDWFLHDAADVAILLFVGQPGNHYDVAFVHSWNLIEADLRYRLDARSLPRGFMPLGIYYTGQPGGAVSEMPLGVGDEVYVVGLFAPHAGSTKNLPIARFGHIARMPSEPVRISRPGGTTVDLQGYLVENRSWGGLSGSPVYWSKPGISLKPVELPAEAGASGPVLVPMPMQNTALLGLVSGHFDIRQAAETTGDVLGVVTTPINAGITVVTPAHDIASLLDREDVVAERMERDDDARLSLGASPGTAETSPIKAQANPDEPGTT